MKYIDLSHSIKNEMPIYPGDKEVCLKKIKSIDEDSYNLFNFQSSMHTGTHIDCPMHMMDDERYICEYPIEKFVGNAVLIDVRGEKEIDIKDEYFKSIKENSIVLLYTGYDSKFGEEEYFDKHPIITENFAEFLVRKKVKMVGIDMPSPDKEPYNVHKMFLENEIFILENLTNLSGLLYVEDFEVCAQPLKIEAEGSLVRAIAYYQGY